MSNGRKFRANLLVVPVICFLIAGYFGYHAHLGMVKLEALNNQTAKAKIELDKVKSSRKALEDKVSLLRPDRLDPDMLDERSRATINAANPADIIIFRERK